MSKRRKLTWPRKRVTDLDNLEKVRRRKGHKPERFGRQHNVSED